MLPANKQLEGTVRNGRTCLVSLLPHLLCWLDM